MCIRDRFKACVLPLSKKLGEQAGKVYDELRRHFMVDYDDAGSIGTVSYTHLDVYKRQVRLGFDNAAAWRNLIRAHRNDIAAAMKIPLGDFRWYAAFHDEGEHLSLIHI